MQTFIAPEPGNYFFSVAGAQGGTTPLANAPYGSLGGLGATVTANVKLQQGASVLVIVAGQGALGGNNNDQPGAGDGGLSAIYTDPAHDAPTIVAGELSSSLGMTINRCSKRTDYLEQKVCIAMKWLQSCFPHRRVVHRNYSRTFILCVSHLCYRWRWRRCRRRSWLCRR